jgi:hypothetical protein
MPDRQIESWILSDKEAASGTLGKDIVCGKVEGSMCSGAIERSLGEDKNYHKPTIGFNLLKAVRPAIMYANSRSFRLFANNFGGGCAWLEHVEIDRSEHNILELST